MKKTLLLISTLATLATHATAAEYRNPVRAHDLPDPSVIRVGNDYWATATSSEWAPHFPLLYSRDLVNWEFKGPVFAERPAWAKSNFWAPEIAEDKGKYFIYYTARDRESNRLAVAVATAPNPGGPYTDHGPLVMEPEGSIDGMAYTDADGIRWLLWKNDGNSVRKPTPIWLQRLSEDGLKLIGERHEILTNDTPWENAVVEGPFVLRHGEYYYMFYSGGACCGRECNYALGVARAKKMTGPWVKAPTNPIMADNEAWRCPGHGSIVTDPQGRYWLLYHAYSRQGSVATGRQMLLDEVVFGADGWPVINGGRGPSSRATAPTGAGPQPDTTVIREEFDGSKLASGWHWMIGSSQQVEVKGGHLSVTVGDEPAGVAQSIRTPVFMAEASIVLKNQPATFAGLVVYGDRANGIHFVTNGKIAQVLHYRRQQKTVVAEIPIDADSLVSLRVACVGDSRFRFAVRRADGRWQEVGSETDGTHLAPWDRAVRVGLGVTGEKGAQAAFDRFAVTPGEPRLLAP